MTTVWRFLKVFTLGTWVGSMIFFGFVAGVLFTTLSSQDQAGNVVAVLIVQLHLLGIVAAVVYILVALIAARSWRGFVQPASILVELMLLATLFAQLWIVPTMQDLRTQMGSYMNTAASSPLRQRFDHLHVLSVRLEGCVLIAGIVALFLTVWQRVQSQPVPAVASIPATPTAVPQTPTHRIV
ncbi:MAG: DUF4149 domain-containing protein [Candidatus Acidiferrales bacterium]